MTRAQLAAWPRTLLLQLSVACGVTAPTAIAVAQAKTPADQKTVEVETTLRPESPPKAPDPQELAVKPDAEGKLQFNFQGQPWQGVLEWLAKSSELSLDWQELPTGFLNLRTQQRYTIEEARDLINRHLLDRGFTLLRHGEVLSVVNIKKADPSLVPRLEPEDLAKSQPHDFVRVSFPLEWMTAETAVEELKPLISPNGKLTALKATNRLEAMDAVANLRQIHKLLTDEQSTRGRERLVREFKLEHVKATEVQPQLLKLLGLDKSSGSGPDPAALVQQMAQVMKSAGVAPGQIGAAKPQAPPVYVVANARDNSILAHAPADQMAIITEAIRVLDNPTDKNRSVLRNTHRVQVYPLAVAEPDTILKMLNDLADLSPETRLQVDRKHRAIVAHATLADHLTIRTLVDKLDSATRNFRVIQLNRLDADYVAGSIDLVMGGGDATKRQTRDPEEEARRFRVVADVDRNRLLLWVNDDELADVRNLLAELGEVPGEGTGTGTTVRIIDSLAPDQVRELLGKLQKLWPEVSPNPLEVGPGALDQSGKPAETSQPEAEKSAAKPRQPAAAVQPDELLDNAPGPNGERSLRLVRFARPNSAEEGTQETADRSIAAATVPPPVATGLGNPSPASIRVDRDREGRLVIQSQDAAAVDLLQKLVDEMVPKATEFQVFRMKHKSTWVYNVAENLRQYFDEKQKAEEKQKTERQSPRWYDPNGARWINSPRAEESKKKTTRRQPKFIVDMDSNSILAMGADKEQLQEIERLVKVYDTEDGRDPPVVRVTRLVRLKHGQVKQVYETVKEVYRDLLADSSTQNRNNQQRYYEPTYTFAYNSAKSRVANSEVLVKFKGQLSIGVEEGSRTFVISAPEPLLENVEATIMALDEASLAAKPRVQVIQLNRGVDTTEVQRKLMKALGK